MPKREDNHCQDEGQNKRPSEEARRSRQPAGKRRYRSYPLGDPRAPTDANAHPHSGSSGRVTLVHNGIIENYLELKAGLEKQGRQFKSQTDTEVLAQLFDSLYDGNPLETMLKVIERVRGSYAVAVLMSDHPDEILAAKKNSPLIVGIGSGANYLASDIPALLKYTRDCAVMQDGEIAIVGKSSVEFFDSEGKPIDKKLMHITWDADSAEKGGYKHFMKKRLPSSPEPCATL